MILTFHPRYLSYFNYLLCPPLKAAVEEILNEIYLWTLFKKCMSRYFTFLYVFMFLSTVSVNFYFCANIQNLAK